MGTTLQIMNTPPNTPLLIAHKDTFKAARAPFSAKFLGNGSKTLIPPDLEVGDIRFQSKKGLIESLAIWKS